MPTFDTGTAYGAIALAVFLLTYLLRRLPVSSSLWALIPCRWRWLVPVVIAFGSAFVEAQQSGRRLAEAGLLAVSGALTAMGMHHAAKDSALPYGTATALVLLLVVPLVSSCSSDQKRLAHFTAENTYAVLELAYEAQAAEIARTKCKGFECKGELDCDAAADCPALLKQHDDWKPVWKAYDALRAAVEAGQTEEAARLYCRLVAIAPAPLPREECG